MQLGVRLQQTRLCYLGVTYCSDVMRVRSRNNRCIYIVDSCWEELALFRIYLHEPACVSKPEIMVGDSLDLPALVQAIAGD